MFECLTEIADNVFRLFETDGKSDSAGVDSPFDLLFQWNRRMRHRPGMFYERSNIAKTHRERHRVGVLGNIIHETIRFPVSFR